MPSTPIVGIPGPSPNFSSPGAAAGVSSPHQVETHGEIVTIHRECVRLVRGKYNCSYTILMSECTTSSLWLELSFLSNCLQLTTTLPPRKSHNQNVQPRPPHRHQRRRPRVHPSTPGRERNNGRLPFNPHQDRVACLFYIRVLQDRGRTTETCALQL